MKQRGVWLAVVGTGAAVVLLGAGVGALLLLVTILSDQDISLPVLVQGAAIAAVGLLTGALLVVTGWRGWRGRASPSFAPRRTWPLWLLLLALIGLGQLVIALDLLPTLFLPPLHILAMALPAWIMLRVTGRALGGHGGSQRDVIAGLAGGALVGTIIAFVVEIVGVVVLVAAGAVVAGLISPDLIGRLQELATQLGPEMLLEQPEALADIALAPPIVAGVLLVFALFVPLIEELSKTLFVGVLGAWVRPSPARAFLWGVASGAGFALAENMLNGALAVGSDAWGVAVGSRVAATLMHCLASGIVGWGWGELWRCRRPWRLLLAGAVGVIFHGLWNLSTVGLYFSGLALTAAELPSPVAAALSVLTGGLLVTLALTAPIVLYVLGRRLGRAATQQDASVEPVGVPGSTESTEPTGQAGSVEPAEPADLVEGDPPPPALPTG